METMNIYQKMLAIENELGKVVKSKAIGTGKNQYKAVSESDIITAVKPLENKYGVFSYPADRQMVDSSIVETESTYNGETQKKTVYMARYKTVYRFVNVDNPSEYIETVSYSEGVDSSDKGSGKAMTYADKYALMKAYKICADDENEPQQSPQSNSWGQKSTPQSNSWGQRTAQPPQSSAEYEQRSWGRTATA